MASLKNNILLVISVFITSLGYSQTYNYTYTDPCTLNRQSIVVPIGEQVVLNYFGEVQAFNQQDFSNGVFDNWLSTVSQLNSSSPCQSVTQVIINETNGTTAANTLTVVTNIMSVMGGGMLPPAESINNSSGGNNSDNNEEGEQNTQSNGSTSNQSGGTGNIKTNQSNQETQGNQSSSSTSGGANTGTTGGSGNTTNPTSGGEQTSGSPVGNTNTSNNNSNNTTPNNSSTESSAEGGATQSTANSLSNAIDGGAAGGGKKSNKAQKQAGSLIASGDVVIISNTDQTQTGQMRFVGSITHANTKNTRIKGALFTYTTVSNDLSLTFYRSWINPKKTFNLVLANTTMYDFKNNLLNTTTALESFRFGKKKFTGMFGLNFTYGKLGERNLKNLSSIGGIHRSFKVSPRISTSLLVLGVYSPFTQFYDGKWWDAGVLIVPFNSWDLKITKTFKYNISFTGVYQSSGNFLNYQILTGGKLNF